MKQQLSLALLYIFAFQDVLPSFIAKLQRSDSPKLNRIIEDYQRPKRSVKDYLWGKFRERKKKKGHSSVSNAIGGAEGKDALILRGDLLKDLIEARGCSSWWCISDKGIYTTTKKPKGKRSIKTDTSWDSLGQASWWLLQRWWNSWMG